jgi:thiamine kinase-like enzyme
LSADLLPRDRALPHLPTALDARAMADVFGSRLARESGATLTGCRIDRIKYRPQRNLSVSYALSLRDAQGREFEQAVGTRWCSGGEGARRHAKALLRPHRPSQAGPALWHVDTLDMVAAWLPNDPKLDGVREMLDDERLRHHWLPEVASVVAPGRRVVSHRTTLVQWMPEHRACARVELELASAARSENHTLYVKTDVEGAGGTTHAVMQALHRNRRLRTSRSIAWQPAAGLHWQQAVEGRPLAELGSDLGPQRGAQVGELIALLHATPVPLPVERGVTIDDLRRERRRTAFVVASIDGDATLRRSPGPATRTADLVHLLERADAALPTLRPATLHGDLHRVNVLVGRDDTLALIDFDGMRRGPAALELGSWIADSMVLALLEGQAPATTAPQWRAMLRAYAEVSDRASMPDEAVLAWATAHQLLVQRAYRCIANLKPGRLAIVPAVLELATAIARERSLDAAEVIA